MHRRVAAANASAGFVRQRGSGARLLVLAPHRGFNKFASNGAATSVDPERTAPPRRLSAGERRTTGTSRCRCSRRQPGAAAAADGAFRPGGTNPPVPIPKPSLGRFWRNASLPSPTQQQLPSRSSALNNPSSAWTANRTAPVRPARRAPPCLQRSSPAVCCSQQRAAFPPRPAGCLCLCAKASSACTPPCISAPQAPGRARDLAADNLAFSA